MCLRVFNVNKELSLRPASLYNNVVVFYTFKVTVLQLLEAEPIPNYKSTKITWYHKFIITANITVRREYYGV